MASEMRRSRASFRDKLTGRMTMNAMTNSATRLFTGGLVFSLDFELFWGVRDHRSVAQYGQNILGVRAAIPSILSLFGKNQIACTWATVGMILAQNKQELIDFTPKVRPAYKNASLDPYSAFDSIGDNESSDPYHFGASLVEQIRQTERQEIGTHTFGHFNCLEEGADTVSFAADLAAASAIMKHNGINTRSIVFPRNQFNDAYVAVAARSGFDIVRGNETSWLYKSAAKSDHSPIKRALRLADAYINLSGANVHEAQLHQSAIDIPSSRFLRPWNSKLALAEPLKLHRIESAMEIAAREGKFMHIWFHPHNFGVNLDQNMAMLSSIVQKFRELNDRYDWQSLNMGEAGQNTEMAAAA